jgi:hypothetical protein
MCRSCLSVTYGQEIFKFVMGDSPNVAEIFRSWATRISDKVQYT